jgi:hypothetical protein
VKEGSGGAYVKVLQPEDTPFCALDGDRVTQISGGPVQVRLQEWQWGCMRRICAALHSMVNSKTTFVNIVCITSLGLSDGECAAQARDVA